MLLWCQVLCASNAAHDQVDPVDPPEGAAVGERVTFQGFEGAPEPVLNPKKKVFEKLAPDLQTDDSARPLPAPEICSSCHVACRADSGLISSCAHRFSVHKSALLQQHLMLARALL